jgi:hypothetical protein
MTTHTPRSITVARWTATGQALISGVLAALIAAFTLAAYVSDRAAARAGHPHEWAGVGELTGVVLAAICVISCLLLALPAARLRADRPSARIALILGEAITCLPLLAPLASQVTRNVYGVLLIAFVGLGIATVVALFRPSARNWADAEPPCTRPIPSERAQA